MESAKVFSIVLFSSLFVITISWGVGMFAPISDIIQATFGFIMIALFFISSITILILCHGRRVTESTA